ncbi:MAG: hypothetical protein C4530_06675 [Desulfobacteraceae bacterium]|nr:MAG: hypothetical protein C4530_06675 [Desulfobacteraceae bacterium]
MRSFNGLYATSNSGISFSRSAVRVKIQSREADEGRLKTGVLCPLNFQLPASKIVYLIRLRFFS